jgi:predicted short-subunit dehydrogenase-like oxidoreductase (DUF2520 family)
MLITIVGSGNVATHLAAALKNAGHRILQVYSRDMQHAAILAYHVNALPVNSFADIDHHTDVFIIAVNDDAIQEVAEQLAPFNRLMVHTSGTTGMDALTQFTGNCGVFYPLQTFSKTKEVDFKSVPLCIEGADGRILALLAELASTISNHVQTVNSDQRKILHLAAVFACNFTNYLYGVAEKILAEHQLDFGLIRPLILETAEKVQYRLPAEVQTGPAIRNDQSTMTAHLELLKNHPEFQNLYGSISQLIIKMEKGS